jgi:CheY-like chemotaxis protein
MTNTNKHELSALITDDIAQNRIYFIDILREITDKLNITEAEDGKDAVNKVANHIQRTGQSFNLIIMDYKMPELNGASATAAIRQLEAKLTPSQHSIILTWSTSLHAAYPQADDWLPKMTNVKDVKAKLEFFDLLHGG